MLQQVEVAELAQRLADQQLAHSFAQDLASAVAEAQRYQDLQNQELSDLNAARRLAGMAPLPAPPQSPLEQPVARPPSSSSLSSISSVSCLLDATASRLATLGTCFDWNSSTPQTACLGCPADAALARHLLACRTSMQVPKAASEPHAASTSSAGCHAAVLLTRGMLEELTESQLLVVQVVRHVKPGGPAAAGPIAAAVVGVYHKHAHRDHKGKSPMRAVPPASMHKERCSACFESFLAPGSPVKAVFRLPCGHSQCQTCLAKTLQVAISDSTMLPLRCCSKEVETSSLAQALLSPEDSQLLHARMEEQLAVNKMFCPNSSCSKFINLDGVAAEQLGRSQCSTCSTDICTSCKTDWHAGYTCAQLLALPEELRASKEDLELAGLAQEQHWQRCPKCRIYVELAYGCYHMNCRCGHHFCYVCSAQWKTCRCPQWDEGRLLLQARQQAEQQAVANNVRLDEGQYQQRVQERVEQLLQDHDCRHTN